MKNLKRNSKNATENKDVLNILSKSDITGIINNELRDPFKVLGIHKENVGVSIRAFLPDAASVKVCLPSGKFIGNMTKVSDAGIFVALFANRKKIFKYEFHIELENGNIEVKIDPYSFLPIMSEESRYLFNEGTNNRLYDDLGSHVKEIDGVLGTVFAVWAPNAKQVSVVGDFNNWDGRLGAMRLLGASGVWELFLPNVGNGAVYKFEVKKYEQNHLMLKTDPMGYYQQPFPDFGSIVYDLDSFKWDDKSWIESRSLQNPLKKPMSIYEVHLGSWRRSGNDEDGDYLTYKELAEQLVEYVTELGYTHVELMPIQEHPYVPSWGYQVTGFYAVNHRFGSPDEFQYFVNYLHKHGIGVILDWVAGHFPKDAHGLAHFDGTHLYDHQDPREGEHKDWGTLIFNYGRHEVKNFLVANALFWLEKFHIDGLRVDAVASILYKSYSREDGEWIPNKYGGPENLEAVEFLKNMNVLVHEKFPGAVTIAEESTSWPMVSRPTYIGGLGFTFKWNMGWMHDVLSYFSNDPIYRKYHQDKLTFGLLYAFTENFVLVLSHDEVVHGKKSLLEKMPGDTWSKFANLRSLYGFMLGHPGKKTVFMGQEFGMHNEWYSKRSIDWHVLDSEDDSYHHQGLVRLTADINFLYKESPELYELDFEDAGFKWIDCTDADNSVLSFARFAESSNTEIIFICNLTPVVRYGYKIGVPHAGWYAELLNTDAKEYGGAGFGNNGGVWSSNESSHGFPHTISVTLPPLTTLVFKRELQ